MPLDGNYDPRFLGSTDVAVLVHSVLWKLPEQSWHLSPRISLRRLEGSDVDALYKDMCRTARLDDGDPAGYDMYLHCNGPESLDPILAPDSVIPRTLTLLALEAGRPLSLCRWIMSTDGFKTGQTSVLCEYTESAGVFNFLARGWPTISSDSTRSLERAWATLERYPAGRISNAFRFFQHAWMASDFDVACLNLAIVLEALCAPRRQSRLGHHVASNAARLIARSAAEERQIYSLLRNFYSVRSALTHGGKPDWRRVHELTPRIFLLVVRLLKSVLVKNGLAATLSDEARRQELFLADRFVPQPADDAESRMN